MTGQIVAVVGTLAGAVLAFALQTLTASRLRKQVIADRTRSEQLAAAAALPAALVEYRHSQIARRMHQLQHKERSEVLSSEVRVARAAAWSALYTLVLLVEDAHLRDAAYRLMQQVKDLKTIEDAERLDAAGTAVHRSIQDFVTLSRERLPLG